SYPGEESLLYMWRGAGCVSLEGASYTLEPYDMLYVPRGKSFALANPGSTPIKLVVTRAPAGNDYPVQHRQFDRISKDESRIRHLKGKDVFLMFDVGEKADKLVAGYTFFQPYSRSWPPHNHTDQEEVYFFIKGRGSMEVYEDPEKLSFV